MDINILAKLYYSEVNMRAVTIDYNQAVGGQANILLILNSRARVDQLIEVLKHVLEPSIIIHIVEERYCKAP